MDRCYCIAEIDLPIGHNLLKKARWHQLGKYPAAWNMLIIMG